jgi:alpha-D-xyloside xylohydrolase
LQDGGAIFRLGEKLMRIRFVTPSIVRVSYTEGREFRDKCSRIVVAEPEPVNLTMQGSDTGFCLASGALTVELDKQSGALRYLDAEGRLLVREPERCGKLLTPKEVRRNIFARKGEVATAQSIDGARAAGVAYRSVFDRKAFEARLGFVFTPDEALFGLGSHEEGYGNLRGRSRDLYQQNMKAVVPFLASTRGYGVLLDCGSAMRFHDDAEGAWWWADCVEELDFYLIAGAGYEEVHRGYHWLTGRAPMLPKWALGYVQSKERYVNAREMVEVVREYRRRRVPLDVIVLDWKSWPDGGGWGQKQLDPKRFPDPEALAAELHELGAHWMISIWPLMTGGCANQREMLEQDFMLGNQSTYSAFLPEARACYWEQARRGLFDKGVDAWWCDCTEPFEADWAGAVKPEPGARFQLNTDAAKMYLDEGDVNTYSLWHSQGIYDGQRSVTTDKRVVNLTRSSYAGQHRYGTITWNGDVSATWETLRRCVPEGVNFCASGEPYWTVDIGGFFIDSRPDLWFWRGDYHEGCRGLTAMEAQEPDGEDTGCRDRGYLELYVRWLQYAVFLPMCRSHGTDAAREIWRFGEEGTPFYDAIAEFIRLRYRMMPYLYSLMAQVTQNGSPMLRGVALKFPEDTVTHAIADQFLLGAALMVCPVTEPMYYGVNSTPTEGVARSRDVYLPMGRRWYDYWTNESLDGGQTVTALAPLERIPLFVSAGSIIPLTEVMQYADEVQDAAYEVRVYTGRDAEFVIYEDKGDGYDYEQGAYAQIALSWSEEAQELVIGARQGSFPEMVAERVYQVILIANAQREEHRVTYCGDEMCVRRSNGVKEFA